MEIWRISPTEHVVIRNFSVSGRRTIDIHGGRHGISAEGS
jgi:hypothetical protein